MNDCPICLEPCEGEEHIVTECCHNHFHRSCYTESLKVNGKCPTCRHEHVVVEVEIPEHLVEVRVPLRIPWGIIMVMFVIAGLGFFCGGIAYFLADDYMNQGLNNTTAINVTTSDVHNRTTPSLF